LVKLTEFQSASYRDSGLVAANYSCISGANVLELRANLDRRYDVHIHAVTIFKLNFDSDIFFVVGDVHSLDGAAASFLQFDPGSRHTDILSDDVDSSISCVSLKM
jgi:hypothetical protein